MDIMFQSLHDGDDADSFRKFDHDLLFTGRNEDNNTVLWVAAKEGRIRCCRVIYERCPELLYVKNNIGVTALHTASCYRKANIVEFLLYAQARTRHLPGGGIEYIDTGRRGEEIADSKLLMMVNNWDNTALHDAVSVGDIQSTILLLEANPSKSLLGMINGQKNTALHIAVKGKKVKIVKLLVEKDPHLGYSVNEDGHTPLSIALEESSSGDLSSVKMIKYLLQMQPSPFNTNEKGWEALQQVIYLGILEGVDAIMKYCPNCEEMVDAEGRNFIHLAAKYGHAHLVAHILRSKHLSKNVLNLKDHDGNTPLHLATLQGNINLVYPLLYDSRVNVKIRNKQGQSALEAITFDYDRRRALYGFTSKLDEKEIKGRSDFDLLVGALICTVSFTSGITVPGGFNSGDGKSKGTAVLYKKLPFEVFMVANTIAFSLSLYAVFSHFCTRHLEEENYVIYQLRFASFCSLGSIFALMAAFISGSFAVMDVSTRLSAIICTICCLFFVVAAHPMWTMIRELRQRQIAGE